MTLYEWFADTARRYPDHIALEADGQTLAYWELEQLAEAVALDIVAETGGVPRRIGLLGARSIPVYAAYLAVLRLGAAVVPLDHRQPSARLSMIAELAALDVVLVHGKHSVDCVKVLPLPDRIEPRGIALPEYDAGPDDEAYVLFTSGSTGRPKGVSIKHRNLDEYLAHCIEEYEVGPGCRLSQTFGLTFDPSVFDLFVAWGSGATVVAPEPNELLTPVDYIRRGQLTHWFAVPSVVGMARQLGNLPTGLVDTVRHSLFAAEPLTQEFSAVWAEVAPGSRIHNIYGPTEGTVTVTGYSLPAAPADWPVTSNGTVPIGQPNPHLEVVVLGTDGLPTVDGELCVRGSQRFDGYLDPHDDLGRFTRFDGVEPAVDYDGSSALTDLHWYRTGDRVTVESGELVHRGRLDQQVKIHGHRIELGEVEAALRAHPNIDQVVVLARDGSLVAAYTGRSLPAADLERWVRLKLPVYMLPRRFEHQDLLPLNANGKIDRSRLEEHLLG